jgi:hypothetical protein
VAAAAAMKKGRLRSHHRDAREINAAARDCHGVL